MTHILSNDADILKKERAFDELINHHFFEMKGTATQKFLIKTNFK